MIARTLSISVALAVVTFAVANAEPLADAQSAYERADYAAAVGILRPLAEQGDARAQYMLGLAYSLGRGVPQDYTAAATWYQRAADRGLAAARANLGTMYANGESVPQDYGQAISLWRAASDY
ncbi:MAG: tetratricopeptide repeat protein [Mycobacteriales bacterium]